ncbi:ribosomal-protein-alanine N-acetyltransferase [Clostridium pascui]|uniref:GNAT family N-acetyltransferase n=1 Tax=Clostridium pascui TaxID=46609 RepID=UPI0019562DCD|nr:GNAT family protein [Clostridium pascui]MBM7872272.1 ribosomal-protein-alanine N-acetyltransferase [Clostridium pascui]
MQNDVCITSTSNKREYIIKDSIGITLGRIYIIDWNTESKYCCIRIRFYKQDKPRLLFKSVDEFLNQVFNKDNIKKINILVKEDESIECFGELGFELEGVIANNLCENGIYKSEFLFGLEKINYKKENLLRKITLSGRNVQLKILTPENSQEILNYYLKNKEHLSPYEPTREEEFYTLKFQRDILIESYKQYLNGEAINFGIYKNDNFIGKIQLSNIVLGIFRSCFIGYSMDKDEQGKGYMKEALKLVTEYGFDEFNLHRIEASALVDNKKSQSVLKACNFKELGINKNYLFIDGKWRDHITYYILRE